MLAEKLGGREIENDSSKHPPPPHQILYKNDQKKRRPSDERRKVYPEGISCKAIALCFGKLRRPCLNTKENFLITLTHCQPEPQNK